MASFESLSNFSSSIGWCVSDVYMLPSFGCNIRSVSLGIWTCVRMPLAPCSGTCTCPCRDGCQSKRNCSHRHTRSSSWCTWRLAWTSRILRSRTLAAWADRIGRIRMGCAGGKTRRSAGSFSSGRGRFCCVGWTAPHLHACDGRRGSGTNSKFGRHFVVMPWCWAVPMRSRRDMLIAGLQWPNTF